MSTDSIMTEALQDLMDEFVDRCRNGESPDIEEYVQRLPEFSEEIRDAFPMLGSIESSLKLARSLPDAPIALPDRFGDYRVVRVIGRGGMGIVYEAIQESLNRRVALKVLPPNFLASPNQVDRFRQEAQSAARLSHPNIVPVFGVGEQSGIHYFVMQLIDGIGLDQIVALGQSKGGLSQRDGATDLGAELADLSVRRAVEIIASGAAALAYAHEQGVMHRDVKPSNILIDQKGNVWLLDFGLAKSNETSHLTSAGDVVGTLRYIAPERLRGEFDVRSDVYSLGLTLYELLTRRPAFEDQDRVRLLRRIAEEDPASPRSFDRSVPRDLDTIVRKAIAKEPHHRYQTALAFKEDLRRFLDGRPIAARRLSTIEKLYLWAKRNPVVAGLSGAMAGILCMTVILAILTAVWLARENRRVVQSQQRAETAERSARHQLFDSLVNQAQIGRATGRTGQRVDGLAALEDAVRLASDRDDREAQRVRLRSHVAASLALPDIVLQEVLPSATALRVDAATGDTQFNIVSFTDSEGRLQVVRQDTAHHGWGVEDIQLTGVVTLLAMNEGGQRLAAVSRRGDQVTNQIIETSSGKPIVSISGTKSESWTCASFSPDGKWLACASSKRLSVLDVAKGKAISVIASSRVRSIAWSPDSERLAAASGIQVDLWSVDLKTERKSFTYRTQVRSVAWNDDGAELVVGCENEAIVHSTTKGNWDRAFRRHGGAVDRATFLSVNGWIASTGTDNVTRIWDSTSCREMLAIEGCLFGYSSEKQQLLLKDRLGSLYIGQLVGVHERLTLSDNIDATSASDIAFLPGTNLLVAADKTGLRIWPIDSGGSPKRVPLGPISGLGVMNHGETLYTYGATGLARWAIDHRDDQVELGPAAILFDQPSQGSGVDLSRNGQRIACATSPGSFRVWNSSTHDLLFEGTHPRIRHVALDPTGKFAATNSLNGPASLLLWDLQSKVSQPLAGDGYARLAFSHDGSLLAVSSPDRVTVRDFRDGSIRSETFRKEASDAAPIAFLGDSMIYATPHHRGVMVLIDASVGEELMRLESMSGQAIVALSWDQHGRRLASAMDDGSIDVWDLVRVRAELRRLGIDWDETFEQADEDQPRIRVRDLQVHLGELASHPRVHLQNSLQGRGLIEKISEQVRERREAQVP